MPKKPHTTRTIGPLHFEDLEPHRFEDLVRRMIYDFRQWRQLEATGRTGSDEGFDVRGIEAVSALTVVSDAGGEEEGHDEPPDRIWLIQCKREKSIPPKKLSQYLDDIPMDETEKLYGIIFAAACDFSKAARDLFREKCRGRGSAEAYLWGKGELEDLLYQPKNDDVLFTFFGISKRIRQRSVGVEVRRKLIVKRKAQRLLEVSGTEVLVRDANDDRYPYPDEKEKDKGRARRWFVYSFDSCRHDGLHILCRRCLAFLDDDNVAWDYAECMNDSTTHNNPWRTEEDEEIINAFAAARSEAMTIWDVLPEKNWAWFEMWLILPYESIIDIDEKGDEWFEGPHIYVNDFDPVRGPFREYCRLKLATIGRWSSRQTDPDLKNRVAKFPRPKKAQEDSK